MPSTKLWLSALLLGGCITLHNLTAWSEDSVSTGTASPIDRVVAAKLMTGYPDGQFHAEAGLSRAELASIIVKVFDVDKRKLPDPSTIEVTDVPTTHWAYPAIQQVLKNKVMQGYRNHRFFPNQKVTRAEGFAILAQAYGVFSFEDKVVDEILTPYSDAYQIPAWARKALATGLHEGFVNTQKAGDFDKISPLRPLNRGDVAYALAKYLDRQEGVKPANP